VHNQQAARPQLHQDTTGVIFFAGRDVFCHFGRYLSGKMKGGSIPSFNGEIFAGMYRLCWIEHSKIQILQCIYKANFKCCKQP